MTLDATKTTVACPHCGVAYDGADALSHCAGCGLVVPADPRATPFARFGLPLRYSIDDVVEAEWLRRSRRVHPDRYGQKSDKERRYAAEQTAALNDAYKVLQDPYDRAVWLVKHAGVPPATLPPQALVDFMEARERADLGADQRAAVAAEAKARFVEKRAALQALLVAHDNVGYQTKTAALQRAAVWLAELLTEARLVDDLVGERLIGSLDRR